MLYLQATTNIIGMHPNRGNFAAELTKRAHTVGDSATFRTIGVWEFVGLSGEWSRVLALYEFANDWNEVCEQIRQTMQDPLPDRAEIYRIADTMRSGGVDNILEPLRGCPTLAEVRADERHGPLLVSDEVTVPPGGENTFGAEALGTLVPMMRRHGLHLVGLYRHALTDERVAMHWSSDLEGYRSLMASGELTRWHDRTRSLRASWHQELWTAAKDSPFAAAL